MKFKNLVLVLLLAIAPLCSAENYLLPGKPDGIALLPPYPRLGSGEYKADLATVQAAFKARTKVEETRATKDATLSLYIFSRAIGPFFKAGKFRKTAALYEHMKTNIGGIINLPKDHWHRTRPYDLDTNLVFGAPERNFSYPSGHSARGTVYALVLAEVFPEKREAILQVGEEIGWDRVLIGKHFPTDVYAGRVVAKAIFLELMTSPAFQSDLAAAKAEALAPHD